MSDAQPKATLSKAVMSMKFMNKKRSLSLREYDQGFISPSNNSIPMSFEYEGNSRPTITVVDDQSFLLPGRRSFGGYNAVVEKNYQSSMEESTISDRLKREQLITDDEMGKYIANRNEVKSKGGSIDTKTKKNR